MFGGSRYDTPFVLEKEPGNKFKVVSEVERTMNVHSEIPFLRTHYSPEDFSKTHTAGFGRFGGTQNSFFSKQSTSTTK